MLLAHPVLRFPTFLMGMMGGLKVVRSHTNQEKLDTISPSAFFFSYISPLDCRKIRLFKRLADDNGKKSKNELFWSKKVDSNALLYIGMLLTLVIVKFVVDVMDEPPCSQGKQMKVDSPTV